MKLHSKILLGLLIGLILGLGCNLFVTDKDLLKWIVENISYPIGQIFIRMIFMIVIPLIFTAIVLGLADFRDIHKIGVVGLKTLMFTIVITAVSVIIGLVIVNLVQPGTGISPESRTELMNSLTSNQSVSSIIKTAEESKSFVQIILDLIPRNPFVDIVYAFDPNYRGGGLLALMFFSLIFGIAMAMSPQEKIQGLTFTLQGIYDVLMKIIGYAMKLAPIGVAGLIFSTTSQLGFKIVSILSLYVLAVLAALAIHFLVTYGVIIKYALKKNPVEFFKQISEVMITAFSTSSSNATLPTTIRNSIDNLKIDKDIANFVLTVGSTANQNGTALYEGMTVLFLAQFYGIELTLVQQLLVVFLSILAGIGTAGVPGGSLPLVIMVLITVGIPAEGIGIILGVDRILDMSRTVVNVTGDVVLAGWIDTTERNKRNEFS
ncbi:MAG: dicarboxylate/amino acid:cation symporter [Ignavibacteriota bacterium]|nr:dicarboxylate/amino acid:cation symporter [Ignavibacteriales bacterium]MBL1123952.1 dicarboxylate/amino acid:cation symporter [Ignavibacteriota bacterium]MEB2295295.1 dicarboxylate/amino acid:cation symporter [Ignavibacteria bacterium]GJQ42788.1 MAG: proton/sodium-glutamate symport protein [Ignavibacteriaceae bacterium]QKJ94865.1 MAG: dicarboxylate/amino acid:cation symporter [Ignavibacteriota bacterium]